MAYGSSAVGLILLCSAACVSFKLSLPHRPALSPVSFPSSGHPSIKGNTAAIRAELEGRVAVIKEGAKSYDDPGEPHVLGCHRIVCILPMTPQL